VLRNDKNEIERVYPYGSEEQQRFERVLEILYIRGQKTLPFRVRMKNGRSVFRSKRPRALARGASFEVDRRCLEELIYRKTQKEWEINTQIEKTDKRLFQKQAKKSIKKYNMTQTAKILGVHRETLYYWTKKRWIKPRRDYRNYPVFTVLDIKNLIDWKNTIK